MPFLAINVAVFVARVLVPLITLVRKVSVRFLSTFRLTGREIRFLIWLYVVVALPMGLLFYLHGWSRSFENGEAFLFIAALLLGAMGERSIEAHFKKGSSVLYFVVTMVGAGALFGLSIFYIVHSLTAETRIDSIEVVWFFVCALWAAAVRNAGYVEKLERSPSSEFRGAVGALRTELRTQYRQPPPAPSETTRQI